MKIMINLYTTESCPMCKMLKKKLEEKNIPFQLINDVDVLTEKNIMHVPVLEIDNKYMNLKEALTWVQEA